MSRTSLTAAAVAAVTWPHHGERVGLENWDHREDLESLCGNPGILMTSFRSSDPNPNRNPNTNPKPKPNPNPNTNLKAKQFFCLRG